MSVDSRCCSGRFDRLRNSRTKLAHQSTDSQLSREKLCTRINGAEPSIPAPTNHVKRRTDSATTASFAINQQA